VELRFLAPAFASSVLQYIASDVDEGTRRARGRLERSLAGISAELATRCVGEVGEADPLMAIDSALVSFPADEIVILPSRKRDLWAEKELFRHVCERFGLPVREIELEEDASGTHATETARTTVAAA
jgi:hypothetical protein